MYVESFLLPLLAVLTALFIWDAMKDAWKQTSATLNKESKATDDNNNLPTTKTPSLTAKEREKRLKELGFDNNPHPFIIGQPVRYAHFFCREDIIENLFNLWKKFPIQNAAIYGEKRIGKTSLLRYLKDVVDNPNDSRFRKTQKTDYLPNSKQYCFIYVDFQDVEYHSPKRLLEYVLQNMKLEQAKQLDLSLSEDNPLLEFGRILSDHLIKPTIILMDEIGVVLERHPEEFPHNFWEGLRAIATTKLEPQCLGFVLASHEPPSELGNLICEGGSPFIDIFSDTIELKAFTEKQARELIASSPKPFSDDDVEFILKQNELKPYLLQMLCQRCLEAMQKGEDRSWREALE